MKISVKKQIHTFNGKTYSSFEDLPESAKKLLDKNQNNIPDIIEESGSGGEVQINIHGKTYTSWDQVPQEYRHFREKLMSRRNDIGDTAEVTQKISIDSSGLALFRIVVFIIVVIAIGIYVRGVMF